MGFFQQGFTQLLEIGAFTQRKTGFLVGSCQFFVSSCQNPIQIILINSKIKDGYTNTSAYDSMEKKD